MSPGLAYQGDRWKWANAPFCKSDDGGRFARVQAQRWRTLCAIPKATMVNAVCKFKCDDGGH
eukprot:11147495-Alexandrium_andersonii.AAC.1